jgi:hypothetical protein
MAWCTCLVSKVIPDGADRVVRRRPPVRRIRDLVHNVKHPRPDCAEYRTRRLLDTSGHSDAVTSLAHTIPVWSPPFSANRCRSRGWPSDSSHAQNRVPMATASHPTASAATTPRPSVTPPAYITWAASQHEA